LKKHKIINRDKKYNGFIDLYEDTLKYGSQTFTRVVIDVADASGILVITEDGDILLSKQYRHPIECELLEIAAGLVEEGEKPIDAAIREAEEELGFTVKNVEFLCEYYAMPGVSNHKLFLYVGYVNKKTAQNLDETEFVEVVKMSKEEFLSYDFKDSKTVLVQQILHNRKL